MSKIHDLRSAIEFLETVPGQSYNNYFVPQNWLYASRKLPDVPEIFEKAQGISGFYLLAGF